MAMHNDNVCYLLDTHVLLWWLTTPKKIGPQALKIIHDKSNKISFSSVSLWEMAIKKSLGRLTFPHNLIQTIAAEGFSLLPIMPEEALGVADLPMIHTDPFDRLLIMQAKLYNLTILTRDAKFKAYPVATLKA